LPKTKEQISAYNKEYFARPEVKERAKMRNAQRRHVRKAYKLTEEGKVAERRYRQTLRSKSLQESSRLKQRYGITLDEYFVLVESQQKACAICGVIPEVKLHVDHDHETGRIRGLLCGSCNRAIGLFKDNVNLMLKAAEYLR
jgi:hypothetical protein